MVAGPIGARMVEVQRQRDNRSDPKIATPEWSSQLGPHALHARFADGDTEVLGPLDTAGRRHARGRPITTVSIGQGTWAAAWRSGTGSSLRRCCSSSLAVVAPSQGSEPDRSS